jgi:beta-N-acetylhexosaminidase
MKQQGGRAGRWTRGLIGALAAVGFAAAAGITPVAGTARAEVLGDTGPLTDRQLAGQRVIYSYPGLTPPPELFDIIRRGEAAGVIFFGENIDRNNLDQIKGVIAQFQAANQESPVKAPLLMMTDQEGGVVRRLPGAPVESAKFIGENTLLPTRGAAARAAGTGAGLNLLSVGMNLNLAPVLDVYRQAGNFIDRFGRSFNMDPAIVSRLGSRFLGAQNSTGVASTVKHFPGLGAATVDQDTDEGPVVLNLTKQQIFNIDELPYHEAIRTGVELVMASWAIYPALDSLPAGLSPKIVQGELRGRLGFKGVTITDALEAGALKPFATSPEGDPPEMAVLAARAGMDLLMFAQRDPATAQIGVDVVTAALESGELDRMPFEASVRRIIALRQRIGARIPSGTVPDAPTIGTAVAGHGTVSAAFTPNGDGGNPILDYTATCGAFSAVGSTSPVVVGVPNGTTVTCTVRARNVIGSSSESAPSNPVTPSAPSGAPLGPTGVTATPGPAAKQISLGWNAADPNGSAITSYTGTCTPTENNPFLLTRSITVGPSKLAVTIGALAPGKNYVCTVQATNALGAGPRVVSTPLVVKAPS